MFCTVCKARSVISFQLQPDLPAHYCQFCWDFQKSLTPEQFDEWRREIWIMAAQDIGESAADGLARYRQRPLQLTEVGTA
jgi:hypothetical protein